MAFLFAFLSFTAFGQSGSIVDKTKGMTFFDGFIPFYWEESTGKIFVEISRFNEEILYYTSLPAGLGSNDIGLDRGRLGNQAIVRFERVGPKVLMIQPNYRYRAITDNPAERAAVQEAFAESALGGFDIIAESNGKVLVDFSNFLIRDAYDVSGTLRSMNQGNYTFDRNRSVMYMPRTKNFPKNTEFEVTVTLSGSGAGAYLRSVTPSTEAVTLRQHHSFVELPDSDYKPRAFDPRAGYFSTSYYDYAQPISEPIVQRVINRHRLEKKNPGTSPSEAIEPIIYYLDRGTPEPIRSALLDGAGWWNQAFEAAGYINAFQVEIMPEGADPMDVRYNMIQWVHRSTRGWSYGSSITDPRTGEIIKGHVTLGSLRVRQDFMIAEGILAPYENGAAENKEMEEMALARLRQLSAHEVGHTIGLAHNYISSAQGNASVMDYPHPKIRIMGPAKLSLANAYDDKIGAWDKVAIRYGYEEVPAGVNEKTYLSAILTEAMKNGLTFLTDQDGRPLGSSHPQVHLWDNEADAADELHRIMDARKIALGNFGENVIKQGMPLATMEDVLVPIYLLHRYQVEATAKVLGGLAYTYAVRGDGQVPTETVDPALQQEALKALLRTLDPAELTLSEKLLSRIPPRPAGFSGGRETFSSRTGVTFDPVATAEAAAGMTIDILLHNERMARLIQLNARDSRQPSFNQVVESLLQASIKADLRKGLEAEIHKSINHQVLRKLVSLSLDNRTAPQVKEQAQAMVLGLISDLESRTQRTADWGYKAHYQALVKMAKMLRDDPDRIQLPPTPTAPPGAPIGMEAWCSLDE